VPPITRRFFQHPPRLRLVSTSLLTIHPSSLLSVHLCSLKLPHHTYATIKLTGATSTTLSPRTLLSMFPYKPTPKLKLPLNISTIQYNGLAGLLPRRPTILFRSTPALLSSSKKLQKNDDFGESGSVIGLQRANACSTELRTTSSNSSATTRTPVFKLSYLVSPLRPPPIILCGKPQNP
jgi:hypothetical protein